jgi:hypothetical protein
MSEQGGTEIAYAVEHSPQKPVRQPIPEMGRTLNIVKNTINRLRRINSPEKGEDRALVLLETMRVNNVLLKKRDENNTENNRNMFSEGLKRYLEAQRQITQFPVVFSDEKEHTGDNSQDYMIDRASRLAAATLQFEDKLNHGKIEKEYETVSLNGKNVRFELDQKQYFGFFGGNREPHKTIDSFKETENSSHFVVAYGGQFYKVDTSSANSAADISKQIKAVINSYSKTGPTQPFIGAFTGTNRDSWAEIRDEMVADSDLNKSSLKVLEGAKFILNLDDYSADTSKGLSQSSALIRDGDGLGVNRFNDKTVQIIVGKNYAGVCFEHSGADGSTAMNFASQIFKTADSIVSTSPEATDSKLPALEFDISHAIQLKEKDAVSETKSVRDRRIIRTETLTGLGKDTFFDQLKPYGIRPDAAFQVMHQAAYAKLETTPGDGIKLTPVVEAFKTRHFDRGRLDLAPTCTEEVAHFISLYLDLQSTQQEAVQNTTSLTDKNTQPIREKALREAFINACQSVSNVASEVKSGDTVLTHLMAANAQVLPPELSSKTEGLLSSQVEAMRDTFRYGSVSSNGGDYEGIAAFGTAPSEATTKALGYIIGKDTITYDMVAAPTYNETVNKFGKTLQAIGTDVIGLFTPTSGIMR